MRSRKVITLTFFAAAGAAAAAFLFGTSRAPVQVEWVNAEPARITDDSGVRMSLVTLRLRNRSSARIEFERNKVIEVRVADGWLPLPQAFYLEEMEPGTSSELLFLIPANVPACRLPLKYQAESLRWRIWRRVPLKVRERIAKSPTLRRSLWPGGNPMPRPPSWTQTWVETALPKASRFPRTEAL